MAGVKTAEEILAEAADLMEFSGRSFVGNRMELPDGRAGLCAVLAIREAAGPTACIAQPWMAMAREIGGGSVYAWNDAPGRTKEEVAAVLRNAKRFL